MNGLQSRRWLHCRAEELREDMPFGKAQFYEVI